MSVIYRNVETLEVICTQQKSAPNPVVAFELQKQYAALKKKIDEELDPLVRLCHPWTYVPSSSIS